MTRRSPIVIAVVALLIASQASAASPFEGFWRGAWTVKPRARHADSGKIIVDIDRDGALQGEVLASRPGETPTVLGGRVAPDGTIRLFTRERGANKSVGEGVLVRDDGRLAAALIAPNAGGGKPDLLAMLMAPAEGSGADLSANDAGPPPIAAAPGVQAGGFAHFDMQARFSGGLYLADVMKVCGLGKNPSAAEFRLKFLDLKRRLGISDRAVFLFGLDQDRAVVSARCDSYKAAFAQLAALFLHDVPPMQWPDRLMAEAAIDSAPPAIPPPPPAPIPAPAPAPAPAPPAPEPPPPSASAPKKPGPTPDAFVAGWKINHNEKGFCQMLKTYPIADDDNATKLLLAFVSDGQAKLVFEYQNWTFKTGDTLVLPLSIDGKSIVPNASFKVFDPDVISGSFDVSLLDAMVHGKSLGLRDPDGVVTYTLEGFGDGLAALKDCRE